MYSQSREANLVVTVDAAINNGNSGGPAMSDGHVVGVAFQSPMKTENMGEIVPVSILKRVLEDFDAIAAVRGPLAAAGGDGGAIAVAGGASPAPLRGFATFAPTFQTLENEALRRFVLLPPTASGILVQHVPKVSNLDAVLRVGDVLTAVDGMAISNDGRVRREKGASPLDFRVVVTSKLVGESLTLSVFREGARLELAVAAENPPKLLPRTWYSPASYVMFAGLVFVPLSAELVEEGAYHAELLYAGEGLKHKSTSQQMVSVIQILPHELTLGYSELEFPAHLPLLAIDGAPVLSLADVAAATLRSSGEWICFSFVKGRRLALPLAEARRATTELLAEHRIPAVASDDIAAAVRRASEEAPAAAVEAALLTSDAAAAEAASNPGPPLAASPPVAEPPPQTDDEVEPVKAKTLELLGVASESVLTTEAVERAVAEKDPAALVAFLQACAIGARTPVANGIASLADAPTAPSVIWRVDESTDPMRGALAAAGALPLLVAMLGDGTAEERAAAAKALGKLAHNKANKKAMAAAGAIEALVALVRDGDAQGKADAAAALWYLAFGEFAIKEAIMAAGAIKPLVALVRDGDARGQENAAAALGFLAVVDRDRCMSEIVACRMDALIEIVREDGDGDSDGDSDGDVLLRLAAFVSGW
jgi:hypothetical protein